MSLITFPHKLGKHVVRRDKRTLRLSKYLSLPNVPASCYWGSKVANWPMFMNDSIGDCTVAAAAHLMEDWSANESTEVQISDSSVLSAYSKISGYNPSTGANDNGADMLTVLKYWSKTGIAGFKIYAYVLLDQRDTAHVKAAVYLFGGTYIGLQMPLSAQDQSVPGGIWSVIPGGTNDPNGALGSWGGHCVPVIGYDANYLIVVSWGMLLKMEWSFFNLYSDESYAVLSQSWAPASIQSGRNAPSGFNLNQLDADLPLVTN